MNEIMLINESVKLLLVHADVQRSILLKQANNNKYKNSNDDKHAAKIKNETHVGNAIRQ